MTEPGRNRNYEQVNYTHWNRNNNQKSPKKQKPRAQRLLKEFYQTFAAAAAKFLHSCPTLCDPIDSSPRGSSVPGILQARTLGMGCHFLLQRMKVKSESEGTQSCPALSDSMDCSLPGSSIHGIFQARVLEWVAIAFSHQTFREELMPIFLKLF